MNTDIRETWEPYLKAGEELEIQFLNMIKTYFPSAYKISGNYKYADFKIPEAEDIKIEIKRDLKSDQTNNFAFEIYFRGKKSGLSITEAKVWIMADSRKFYCFDTEKLKDFCRLNWQYLAKKKGGDGNEAEMILIDKKTITNQSFCCSLKRDGSDVYLFYPFMRYNYLIN